MLNNLTFEQLATANLSRSARWHELGKAHTAPGFGMQGWTLSDWFTAFMGEIGEAGNIIKKLNRHRDNMLGNVNLSESELRSMLAAELADAAIYLDLLAQASGIDLGTEIIAKFNRKSEQLGFPERLGQ